jgi:hypothetical protein
MPIIPAIWEAEVEGGSRRRIHHRQKQETRSEKQTKAKKDGCMAQVVEAWL